MTNKQLIKYAHIWILAVLLACGVVVAAVKGGVAIRTQNSNQNSNSNTNTNTQNRNANRSSNRNAGAKGEQTGMANMSSSDHNFLMDAAMGGMMEVELGKLATTNGASDAVKQFGQRMVDDHSKANAELMSLATTRGITLPTELDEKHRAHVTKLTSLTGADFDREYSKMMLSDHKKDVSEFEKESMKGADADLKAFATNTLPTLREHLQMANALPGNERGSNSNRSNTNRSSNSNRNNNGNTNRP